MKIKTTINSAIFLFALLSFSKIFGQETILITNTPVRLSYFIHELTGNIKSKEIVTEVGFCISKISTL